MMTENGQSAQVDNVTPHFASFALTDLWEPNDRLVVNLGARLDHFQYATNDLEDGYPARQFWFDAYNDEYCGAPGKATQWTWNSATGSFAPLRAGFGAPYRARQWTLQRRGGRERLQRLSAAPFVHVHD